jgi:hypothetical protein
MSTEIFWKKYPSFVGVSGHVEHGGGERANGEDSIMIIFQSKSLFFHQIFLSKQNICFVGAGKAK